MCKCKDEEENCLGFGNCMNYRQSRPVNILLMFSYIETINSWYTLCMQRISRQCLR